MELLTQRFLLRDFTDADLPAFEAYHADPRSLEFYGPSEARPAHARELIRRFQAWAAESPRRNYQLAIVRRRDPDALLGSAGLRTAEAAPGTAELGIELAPDCWGRYGYALEVLRALVDFGFGTLGLREIYGATVSANQRIGRRSRPSAPRRRSARDPSGWRSAGGRWSSGAWAPCTCVGAEYRARW